MKRSAAVSASSSKSSRKRVPSSRVQRTIEPDDHAPVVGEPAEDQHRVGEEGDQRLEVGRVDGRQVEREEPAGDRGDRRPRSPATGACRRGRSCRAPGRRPRPRGSRAGRGPRASPAYSRSATVTISTHGDRHQQQRRQRSGVGPAEVLKPALDRLRDVESRCRRSTWSGRRCRRSPGCRRSAMGVLGDDPDQLGARDRRDREVVRAQAQRRQPDQQPEEPSPPASRAAARARTRSRCRR